MVQTSFKFFSLRHFTSKYIKLGSLQISWRHNSSLISYSGPRPGVSMITDKSPSAITVTLIISSAGLEDSGLYSCLPQAQPALPSANVSVIVLQQIDYTAMLSLALPRYKGNTKLTLTSVGELKMRNAGIWNKCRYNCWSLTGTHEDFFSRQCNKSKSINLFVLLSTHQPFKPRECSEFRGTICL